MANQHTVPSHDLWRSLYTAADLFFKESPWKVLENGMIFGVEDPVSKQIGWCSVMGNGGMEYGLAVHRGAIGFEALKTMLNDMDHENLLPLLDSLNVTFDHSDFLEKRDLSVLKELGISSVYKGTQKWPRFRSYLPARYPWYLNADEAFFLKEAIEQAMEVARLARMDRSVLAKGFPDRFLVRTQTNTSGIIEWRNEYRIPECYIEPQRLALKIDKSKVEKISSLPISKDLLIEADLFITSTPICDSEPPWLPWLMLAVDVRRDFVLNAEHMMKDRDPIIEGSRQLILILEGLDHRPGKIRIKHDQWHRYLKQSCADIGILLEKATFLPAIKKVKESMREYMRWDREILDS